MKRAGAFLLAALLLASFAAGQTPPSGGDKGAAAEVADLVNSLLGGLLGGGEVTGERLQEEVAEAGGLPFREKVEVAFLGREELAAYLRELFDAEYPVALARVDERLLQAFDLLPPDTDLRALRARVLEENVAGFYDERPGKRRLYAVSEDRSFSPMNQVVLVHELRHAQQDQYEELDAFLGDDVSDFDDRRLAWMSLLEGDATLVMERFVRLRLGSLGGAVEAPPAGDPAALGTPGLFDVPGAPPVVRDQLVQPYLAGLSFARALWARGGGEALREAWGRPPQSTEQVLHPAKFFSREKPRGRGAGGGGAVRRPAALRGRARRDAAPHPGRGRGRGRRGRLGRRRLASLGRRRADGARVAQRVGPARPTPGSSTPRCERASRGTGRPPRAGGGRCSPRGAGGASRCGARATRWSCVRRRRALFDRMVGE